MQPNSIDLWFDDNAEEAANFYTSIFPNSRIVASVDYPEGAPGPAGSVMYVQFELNGQLYGAVNGGPVFKFNEAVSIVINCDDQEEVDYYWEKLSAVPESEQCGWVKDKFGLSWQVVPTRLGELMTDPDPGRATRAMQAMLGMKKLDIAALEAAANG